MGRKYNNEDLLKAIYKLKTHKGLSFEQISVQIKEDFGVDINKATIGKYYHDYVTKASVIRDTIKDDKRKSREISIDWNKKIEEKFSLIDNSMNQLMNIMNSLIQSAYNSEDKTKIIRLIPTVISVAKEIREQLNFIKKQQDNIITNQKNVIYSPLQIMEIINKEMKRQISDNGIRIIDKEGNTLDKLFD